MSSYDGPLGKATLYASSEPKTPVSYEGEIVTSDAVTVTIVVTEHRVIDGAHWYGEVEYCIPWARVLHIEQPIKRVTTSETRGQKSAVS